jgi:hypothetical protein
MLPRYFVWQIVKSRRNQHARLKSRGGHQEARADGMSILSAKKGEPDKDAHVDLVLEDTSNEY